MGNIRYLLENVLPWPTSIMFYLNKRRWDALARQNPFYYVYSKPVSEQEFWDSGKTDYEKFVSGDALLNSVLQPFNERTMLEVGGSGSNDKIFCR